MGSITSVNSVYMLAVVPIFPAAQRLVGFSADDAFSTEAGETAENVLGVDGRMSSGWVPRMVKQTISIMPDSETSFLFEEWASAQDAAQELFPGTATIALPSIQRKYTLNNGILTSFPALPDAKKVMQARQFVITWGKVTPSRF